MGLRMAMGVTVAMTVAIPLVGAGLRAERRGEALDLQTPLAQQIGQHGVLQQHQLISVKLHRHMAIAQVISRLQQGEWITRPHAHHRLRRGVHAHQGAAVIAAQQLTRLQGRPPGQLQQHRAATGAAALSTQAGALICRQRQLQLEQILNGSQLGRRDPLHQHNRARVPHR